MKLQIRVKPVAQPSELAAALRIRLRVFVKEQGVPREIELDRDDARALHLLASVAGKPVGTARVVMRRSSAKIGRMAVLKSYRSRGIGAKLLDRAVETAKKRRARKIYLHAQVAVIGFYERFGFRSVGPVFEEAGIAHRMMTLRARSVTLNEVNGLHSKGDPSSLRSSG